MSLVPAHREGVVLSFRKQKQAVRRVRGRSMGTGTGNLDVLRAG
jgi:hypothetical protein